MKDELYKQAEMVGAALLAKSYKLVTAESCTGGYIAQTVTSVPESSNWFERGFVTYSNEAKQELLDVNSILLEQYGAVSEQTALAMVEGALEHSHAQCAISVTGIAGPSGGTPEKPVGMVWFGFIVPQQIPYATQQQFLGDRRAIRKQSVQYALQELLRHL